MKKQCIKLLSTVLMISLLILGMPHFVNAEDPGLYTFDVAAGTATITGYSGDLSGAITIPATVYIDTTPYPVIAIADYAFEFNENITSVVIENGIQSIGDAAFYENTGITSISFPDSITNIGAYAFFGNTSLQTLVLPDPAGGLTVGTAAFAGCSSLTSLTIPPSLTVLAPGVFSESGLTSVTIPATVTSIGDLAFYGSDALVSAIFMGNAPTSMGLDVFDSAAAGFAVYYYPGATGFVGEPWVTYDAQVMSYVVSFYDWDNTFLDEDIVEHNGTAVYPEADPTRTGYTFTGWDKSLLNVLSDMDVYAQYTANQYTITFDSDGGSPVASITQGYETAVTPPAPPTRAGYTFAGWDPELPTTMPLNGAALTAQWTVNQYTITFNSAGGSAVAPITQDYDTSITAPADPTRIGYTFAGWTPALPTTMPANDMTVTAQWTANEYTITFDSDGGSPVASITQGYETAVTPPAPPTRTGYTFAGWDPELPATMPLNGAALTAQWTVNQYTITFNSAGGSAVAPITQDYGTPITAPADPTRTGYTFAGWTPALPTTIPANDMTVTAQWTANQYTITFDSAGGSSVPSITQDFDTPVTLPVPPTRTGYTFAGWDPVVPATMPAADLTVTAQWTVNQYTITFNSAGGSPVLPITQDYGTSITAPADPTRTGYTFAGWSPAVPATMPAANMTLMAQWTANPYTITFDSAGGSPVASITQGYETAVTPPADPTRTGYTFAGWTPELPATMPLNGVALTAQWTINQYTIMFNSAGGSAVAPITQDYGTPITAPADPTRTGYTFAGWTPELPENMPLGGGTVSALWTIKTYTVVFKNWDGTILLSTTVQYGQSVTAPQVPEREGYTFAGWDIELDFIDDNQIATAMFLADTGEEDDKGRLVGFALLFAALILGLFSWRRSKRQPKIHQVI